MHEGQPRPRGSESYEQVLARLNDGIQAIISQNPGKCVAIFTHGKALRILNEQWAKTDATAAQFRENECKSKYLGFRSTSLITAEYTDAGEFIRLMECGRYDYLLDENLKIATE
jgi:broad specificity phosphatase PhoE